MMGISNKSTHERNRSILIASLVIAGFIVFVYSFNSVVGNRINYAAESDLNERSIQQQRIVDKHFVSVENGLVGLAESLTLINNEEDVIPYIKKQMANFELQEVYIVDLNGEGESSESVKKDFSEKDYFIEAVKGQDSRSKAYESSGLGMRIMDLATPIYAKDGEIEAVLVGEYSLGKIISQLDEAMGGQENSYALVVEDNGEALISTKQEYVSLKDLNMSEFEEGDTKGKIIQDLQDNNEGECKFTLDDTVYIANYRPLANSELSLVLVAEEDAILPEVRTISMLIMVSSILSLIIVVSIIVYFLIAKDKQLKKVEKVAYYDSLTGLPNIMGFKILVKEALKKGPNNNYAMVKLDIENFKAINEMFGYEVGNKVLRAYKTTSDTVTEPTFIIGRMGADGIIMFAGNGFLEQLDETKDHFEEMFVHSIPVLEKHRMTYRYGRYFLEKGETDVDDIVNKVGMAHSMAKKVKSNKIWNYDDKLKQEALQLAEITNKMEKALNNEEFVAFLQPKFRLEDEKLIGAEALVRWIEEDGNMIYPNDFIPLFEKNGFIVEIDKHILTIVCKHIRNWINTGKEVIPVSVNFSRVHIGNPNFVDDIIEIVDKYKVPHGLIEIELTETTVLGNEIEFTKVLSGLGKAGITVSIDDFGAGYSSLGLLKNLKADTLKLDRSFFIGNEVDERGEVLIEGVVNLAHSLGMSTVAEGIEDKKQIDFLTDVGCKTAQGYYYDRPMPIKEFENKFINSQK